MAYIGIDLGGTKIETVLLNDAGEKLAGRRTSSPRDDYQATIRHIADEVSWLEQTAGLQGGTVGIGIPGCISPATGLVKNANSTWLNGQPLDKDLAAAIGRPVRVENDANCLALSEAVDGAGTGKAIVWAVIIGTGSGSGLVAHGKLLKGANGNSGEYAHNRLPDARPQELPGPACYCGKNGCIETWVSGPGLANDHKRRTGKSLTAEQIAAAAAAGDMLAQRTLNDHADRLARSFANVINIVDPDVIVLGGGLSKMAHLYEMLPRLIAPWYFAANPNMREPLRTDILPAKHGDASGVRGAAWLWRENSGAQPHNASVAGAQTHGLRSKNSRRSAARS